MSKHTQLQSEVKPKAVIDDWVFQPVKDAGVCLKGRLPDGTEWITTEVKKLHREGDRRFVVTESGTIYELGAMKASIWAIVLQMRRPEIYDELKAAGFI